jgi:uncharacterized protein
MSSGTYSMKPKISMTTLGVTDLKRSIEFYRDGLGFPLRSEHDNEVAFFDLPGSWLALYLRDELAKDAGVSNDGSGFRAFALAHNVESKDAVDAVLAKAVDAGATITKPAVDASWGGYSGYFADPDGFLWEVAWNPYLDLA